MGHYRKESDFTLIKYEFSSYNMKKSVLELKKSINCCIDTIKSLFVTYVNFKEFFKMQKMENVAKRLKCIES